jgi:hypothetical protein
MPRAKGRSHKNRFELRVATEAKNIVKEERIEIGNGGGHQSRPSFEFVQVRY